jgi:hypothetical protein
MIASASLAFLALLGQASESPVKPSEFARAAVQALAQAGLARDAIEQPEDDKAHRINRILNEMIAERRAIARAREAISVIENYKRAKDPAIAAAAESFELSLDNLIAGIEATLVLQEGELKATTPEDIAALVPTASKIAAHVDESWRTLPKVFILVAGSLVDQARVIDSKLPYLRISSVERKDLVAQITTLFPNARDKGGGHAVDVAASLLRKFLQGDHKSSDERAP